MLGRSAVIGLLMLGPSLSVAEALQYRLGPVPEEWKLSRSEIPQPPQVKKQPAGSPSQTGEVSKFERDFSGPVNSPGFGAPIGSATGVENPLGSADPVNETGALLVDCQPGQIFIRRMSREMTRDYLAQKSLIFTVELIDGKRIGVIRAAELPHPKESILAIVLGRSIPQGLVFKPGGAKGGLNLEVWKEGGIARIILKKRPDDGRLVEAVLMAPGRKSVSSLWRVKEWKDGQPTQIACTNFGAEGYGVSSDTLYTLAGTAPSQPRTPNDLFEKGLPILDQRVHLESGSADVSYPWQGQILDAATLKRLDQEREVPLPGWMKGPQAALNGALAFAAACCALVLAVFLSRRFGASFKK